MTEPPPERIDVTAVKFTLYASLEVFPKEKKLKVDRPIKLVAVSNKYGLLFVGTPNGIQCVRTADIPPHDDHAAKNYLSSYKRREFHLGTQPTHLDVSCDNELLAVTLVSDGCAVLQVYFVQSVSSSEVKKLNEVRLSNTPGVFVSDLQWNPGVPGMIAVVMSDGSAAVIEFKDGSYNINSIPQNARASCLCWSPKGKQVVIGAKNGSLIQYKPELKAVKTCDPPKLGSASMAVVSVHWLSNTQFIAVYKDTSNPSAKSNVVIVNTPKNSPPRYVYYDELFFESETSRPEHYFIHQQLWHILVIGTTNSMDAIVLKMDGDNWTQWMQEDGSRAELPLTQDYKDVFNVGLAVDYSSTRPIPIGENLQIGPMPLLVMYADSGVLCLFHMINVLPDVPNVCHPPQPLQDTSGLHLFITPEVRSNSAAPRDEKKIQERQSESASVAQPPAPGTQTQPINLGFGGLSTSTALSTASRAPTAPSTGAFSSAGQMFSFSQSSFAQSGMVQAPQNVTVTPLLNQLGSSPANLKQPSLSSPFSFANQNVPSTKSMFGPPTGSWPTNEQQKPLQQGIAASIPPANVAINVNASQQSQDAGGSSPFSPPVQPREEKKTIESDGDKVLGGQPTVSSSQQSGFISTPQTTTSLPSQTPTGLLGQTGLAAASSQGTIGGFKQLSFIPPNQANVPPKQADIRQEKVVDATPAKEPAQQVPEPEEIDVAKANEMIIQHTKELVAEFNSEMEEKRKKIRSYVAKAEQNLKDNSLKDRLLNDLETLKKFEGRLRDSRIPELSNVNMLGSSLMELFAWYEKIKAKERLTKTPGYIELMESQDLDPVTKHYLKSIDKHVYYLESQIKQAKNKLGALWDNLESTMDIPAMEAIYQSLVAHHNILAANKLIIDNLEVTLKKMNRRRLNRSSRRKVGDLELSTLADRLLDTKLTENDITMDSSLKDVSNNYIVMANKSGRKLFNEDKMNAFYDWLKNHKVINTKVSKNVAPVNACRDSTFIADISSCKQSTPYITREPERKDIISLPRKNLFPSTTVDNEDKNKTINISLKFNIPASAKLIESNKIDGINAQQKTIPLETNNLNSPDKVPTPAYYKGKTTSVTKTVPDVISTAWGAQTPVFNVNPVFSSIKPAPSTVTFSPTSEAVSSIPKTSFNVIRTPQGASSSKSVTTAPSQVDTKSSKASVLQPQPSATPSTKSSMFLTSSSGSFTPSSFSDSVGLSSSNSPQTGGSIHSSQQSPLSNSFTNSSSNVTTTASTAITSSLIKVIPTTGAAVASPISNQTSQSSQAPTTTGYISPKTTGSSWTTGSSYFAVPSPAATTSPTPAFGTSQNFKTSEFSIEKLAVSTSPLSLNFGNPSSTAMSTFSFAGQFITTSTPTSTVSSAATSAAQSLNLVSSSTPHSSSVSPPLFGSSTASSTSITTLVFGNPNVTITPGVTSPMFGNTTPAITGTTPNFGNPTATSTTSASSPLFGSLTPATPGTTTVNFGSPTASSTTTASPPLFFGSSTTGTTTTSSSLIFASPTGTSTTTTSVPLFGSSSSGKTTTTSSIFGNAASSFTSPTSSTTLFGNSAGSIVTSPSVFSSSPGVSTPLVFGGLSGVVTTTSSSMFGSAAGTATTSSSIFGGSIVPATTVSSLSFGSTPSNDTSTSSSIVFGAATSSLGSPSTAVTTTSAASTTALTSTPSAPATTSSVAPLSSSVTVTPVSSPPTTSTTSAASSIFSSATSTQAKPVTSATNATTVVSTAAPSTPIFAGANSNIFGGATATIFDSFKSPTTSAQPFFPGSTSFVASTTSPSSIFGSATKTPAFGVPATSSFGSPTTTSFGAPATTTSFGAPATTTSFFGNTSALTTSATPTFGSNTETSSMFGAAAALSAASFFNTAVTTAAQPFTNQSAASIFGGSSSFGTPTTTSSASFFGKTICSPTSTSNVFGTSNANVFGQASTTSSNSLFGGSSFQQKPAFGQSGSLFSQTTSSGGNFGSSGGSLFGGSSGFGNTMNQQANIFQSGNTSPGLFSNAANTSGPFSSPTAGNTAFGGPPAFQSPQRPFGGAAPVFGSSPAFGTAPSFGGSATFNTSPAKSFGSPTAAAPSFATPGQQSSTFENLAQQETVSFGNLAQQQTFQDSSFAGSSFSSWR